MAGLWIMHGDVTDEQGYGEYVATAGEVIRSHGGEFIARGGRYRQMEGREYSRNVVVRFDTIDDAIACYNSADYQAIVGQAIASSDRNVVMVETNE